MPTWYDQHASDLVATYEALSSEDVHQSWCHLLEDVRLGLACDIGAGSGRDARWLVSRGWDVVAVEQSKAMLSFARDPANLGPANERVVWMEDALPSLQKLRSVGYQFDLILLSAVWQHVPEAERERAFRILSNLLKPGGVLVITLRHGKNLEENEERGFLPVSGEELSKFARSQALTQKLHVPVADLRRSDVSWETFVFQLPDDGSGDVDVPRAIAVNDLYDKEKLEANKMVEATSSFFDAWEVQDADTRLEIISRVVSPKIHYCDPRTPEAIEGLAPLNEYLGNFSKSAPGWSASVVKNDIVDGLVRSTVAFSGPGPDGAELTQLGQYFVEVEGDLIHRMVGFVGTGSPD